MKGKPLMVIKNVKDVVRSGLPKKLMELCSRVALLEVSWDKTPQASPPRLEGMIKITKVDNGYVMEIDNRCSKVFASFGGIMTELLDRFEHRSPSWKGLSYVKVTMERDEYSSDAVKLEFKALTDSGMQGDSGVKHET